MRFLAVLTLTVLVIGCRPKADEVAPNQTWVVQPTKLEVVVDELGVIESTNVSQIVVPFRSRLVSVLDDGSTVKAGDVVATMETTGLRDELTVRIEELKGVKKDLEAAIEQLSISLRSNSLDLSSSVTELDLARVELADVNQNLSELERLKSANIVEGDAVLTAESQLRRTQITTLQRDMDLRSLVTGSQTTERSNMIEIQRLELRGKDRRSRIDETAEQITQAEIKTPTDGLFIREKRWNWQLRKRVEREAGEEVREGELLGTIPDLRSLLVRSQVPESEMLRVNPGTDVRLIFESLGGITSAGRVSKMAPIAVERETSAGGQITASGETLSGEKVFEVEIEILEPDSRMKPGLTARAVVVLDSSDEVLAIPLESVSTENGKHFIRVKTGEKWTDREVELGQANDRLVEVIDGVTQGDIVFVGDALQRG